MTSRTSATLDRALTSTHFRVSVCFFFFLEIRAAIFFVLSASASVQPASMRVGSVPTEQQLRDRLQIHKVSNHLECASQRPRCSASVIEEHSKKVVAGGPFEGCRNCSCLSWVGAICDVHGWVEYVDPAPTVKSLLAVRHHCCGGVCTNRVGEHVVGHTPTPLVQGAPQNMRLRPHVGHPQTLHRHACSSCDRTRWPPDQASCMKHSYSRRSDTAPFSMHHQQRTQRLHLSRITSLQQHRSRVHPKLVIELVHRGTLTVSAARSTCASRCGTHRASASRGERVAITCSERRDSSRW